MAEEDARVRVRIWDAKGRSAGVTHEQGTRSVFGRDLLLLRGARRNVSSKGEENRVQQSWRGRRGISKVWSTA